MRVLKFPCNVTQLIDLPLHDNHKICLVARQDGGNFGEFYIWAEQPDDDLARDFTKWSRKFRVFAAGQIIPHSWSHMASWGDGPAVWHLYEDRTEPYPVTCFHDYGFESRYENCIRCGKVKP